MFNIETFLADTEDEWLNDRSECACGYKAFDLNDHDCLGPSFTIPTFNADSDDGTYDVDGNR